MSAADAVGEISGLPEQSPDEKDIHLILKTVRSSLDEKTFQEAWQAGREMTTQEAISYALEE